MATKAQIDANRRNSQRSTGPRTAAGKAASSQNALRHGFYAEDIAIGEEDAPEFEALQKDYFETCDPEGHLEIALVLELVRCDWLLRRTTTFETQSWNYAIEDRREWLADHFDEDNPLVHGYNQISDRIALIQRRLTALSRTWHRALKDLQHLQSARATSVNSPEPPPEIGFVPQKPESSAPQPPVTEPSATHVEEPTWPPAPIFHTSSPPEPNPPPARAAAGNWLRSAKTTTLRCPPAVEAVGRNRPKTEPTPNSQAPSPACPALCYNQRSRW